MRTIAFSVLGDCCIDRYIHEKKTFLGGTAFNVAYHAKKAGAKVTLISSVGKDAYGKKYLAVCKTCGIASESLRVRKGNTSSVAIISDENRNEKFAEWDIGVLKNRRLTEKEKIFLATQDIARAVLFKPVNAMFESFARLNLPHTLKVGDFLGSSDYSYRTSPIKAYARNFDVIIKSIEENEKNSLAFLQDVAKHEDIIVIALLGEKGSTVFTKEKTYYQDAIPTHVTNTTGAGDTYQAYFCYWYKKTRQIPKAMREATKAATQTITHLGASYPRPI